MSDMIDSSLHLHFSQDVPLKQAYGLEEYSTPVDCDDHDHSHTGPIGTHKCGLYKSDEELAELSKNFIIEGLKCNDKIGYFYYSQSVDEIKRMVSNMGIDIDTYVKSKQIEFFKAEEIYIAGGKFEPQKTLETLQKYTEETLKMGYSRLRITGEMSWAHPDHNFKGNERILEYEAKIAGFFERYPCIALCLYDMRMYDSPFLLTVLNTHPVALIGTEEFDNIYYMPPTEFLDDDFPTATLRQWINNLKERKNIESRLRKRTKELLILNEQLHKEIEERKRMQHAKETAEALSKAHSNFMSIMSHEIRTPLNGIVCMSNLLSETPLSLEQREYVNVIDVSSQHLLTVLSDMLDYNKLESGQLKLESKPMNVRNCLSGVIDLVKEREKPLTITQFVDHDVPPYIVGDVTRIRQILFNLVSNAIKFTSSDGNVMIRVDTYNDNNNDDPNDPNDPNNPNNNNNIPYYERDIYLLFTVKDTGIGIPRDKWDFIFQSFTQVDNSITRKYNGTGLGLSICKKLVELMGGKIWLNSEVGVGSEFYFTIKTRISTERRESRDSITALSMMSSNINGVTGSGTSSIVNEFGKRPSNRQLQRPLKILIAEDNSINQKVILKIFDKLDYNPVLVQNGYEAVNEIERNDYDVIFMDLLMPVMGGLEATRIISGLDWSSRKRPKIIAMTASASEDDKRMCYQAGMDFHISKPINIDLVKQCVECLEKGKHLRTLEISSSKPHHHHPHPPIHPNNYHLSASSSSSSSSLSTVPSILTTQNINYLPTPIHSMSSLPPPPSLSPFPFIYTNTNTNGFVPPQVTPNSLQQSPQPSSPRQTANQQPIYQFYPNM